MDQKHMFPVMETYAERQARLIRVGISLIRNTDHPYLLEDRALVEMAKQTCADFFTELMPEFNSDRFYQTQPIRKEENGVTSFETPVATDLYNRLVNNQALTEKIAEHIANEYLSSIVKRDTEEFVPQERKEESAKKWGHDNASIVCDSLARYAYEIYQRITQRHAFKTTRNTYQ